MTPEEKLRGAIGLSMKAGKCQSGDFQVERTLKRGGIVLVLLDAACSEATRERYTAYRCSPSERPGTGSGSRRAKFSA